MLVADAAEPAACRVVAGAAQPSPCATVTNRTTCAAARRGFKPPPGGRGLTAWAHRRIVAGIPLPWGWESGNYASRQEADFEPPGVDRRPPARHPQDGRRRRLLR